MAPSSPVVRTPLLLPHFPELVIRLSQTGPVIEQMPLWLAELVDGSEESLIGKRLPFHVGERVQGLLELVENVAEQGNPITGYQSEIIDLQGRSQRLILDAFPGVLADGSKSVRITLQAFPDRAMVETPESGIFQDIIGRSAPMRRVFNKVRLYAAVTAPVLVTGETGSGKEGVAHALHKVSSRRNGPFVAVNCSAISENLFESELFGHEKGSFTGAMRAHKGRFERAHGGTLFLDEIGDIPASFQSKLLRVIENGIIDRVGGEKPVEVDVRLVAATNRGLEEDTRTNRFRPDLFYRISALQIQIPPLRERADDIPDLVNHFIGLLNEKYHRNVAALTPEAVNLLQQYWWPGNVRELRNLMERLFAENQSDVIGLRSLRDWHEERVQALRKGVAYDPRVTTLPYQPAIRLGMENQNAPPAEHVALEPARKTIDLSEEVVRKAITAAGGNMTQASRNLGIHKATLYRYLKAQGITRESVTMPRNE